MPNFKTRARAVDMLGRQQIAGVPNAISELFKNAHDAYADQAIVDYFRSKSLFVLRDDGLGMTAEDFEERWLTLGTESKVDSKKGTTAPPIDPNKPLRLITGEKGIGRLSIAAIGPQVLVLSRAKREDRLHDLVVAFLNWTVFSIPGINLEQIEIPVRTFKSGTLPTGDDIQKLVEVVRSNVIRLFKDQYIDNETANYITSELTNFKVDPANLAKFLGKPGLIKEGHGTHFYVLPARDELAEDLVTISDPTVDSRIRKLLLGFNNTMVPGHEPPQISTSFRYRPTDDARPTDIIAAGEFFTPEEFLSADHHMQGVFNEYGQFIGIISVYGEKKDLVVQWQRGKNKRTVCGPFRIDIGVVPGVQRQSKLPPEEWSRLTKKLNAIGGLYIYKDGIRILPYGDNDVDFLNIEKRRTQGAGYYFFSYRRMFGAIELTQEQNHGLSEKAGREGFQDNRAYREFRDILENFLVKLAADFFREGGEHSEVFIETRNELERRKTAREQQEKESQKKRKLFSAALDNFFEMTSKGDADQEANTIIAHLLSDIQVAAQHEDDIALLNAEVSANHKFSELRKRYKIDAPDSIGLTPQLSRDWNAYVAEITRLERDVFSVIQAQIQPIISETSEKLKFALDKKQRVELLVNEIVVESRKTVKNETGSARENILILLKRFDALSTEITDKMAQTRASVEFELSEFDIASKNADEIELYRHNWEEQVDKEAQQYVEILRHIKSQVESINWYRNPETGFLIGNAQVLAALEDEVLALREQVDADVELTQLGMALNIINHEFTHTVVGIRDGLRRLRSWANDNSSLKPVYQEIYDNFTYLDGYLNLFTPLNRRLYRSKVDIRGSAVGNYINKLFGERLKRHEINLVITENFNELSLVGYPSTYYPTFVNLVDNAIFWLSRLPLPREITLDVQQGEILVSDNGPGISKRDQASIFEMGFTRKPGGRGMGLHISREALKKEGFLLELESKDKKKGTTFIIKPIDSQISNLT